MARVIMITSGKGGVGKTTVCANLGIALASLGKKVCMIDMDLGLKNLDVMMGLENRVFYDLKDAVEGRCPLSRAMIQDKRCENLFLMAACRTVNIGRLKLEDLTTVIDQLQDQFDFILLDSPAGIERGFQYAMCCADEALVVVQLDIAALQDSDRVIGILLKEGKTTIRLVMNRVNPRYIEKGISLSVKEAADWLGLEVIGLVYEDENMIACNNRGVPMAFKRSTITSQCYTVIAQRLLGEKAVLPKFKEKNIIQKLFG